MFSRLHRRTLLAGALFGAGFGAALPHVVRAAESSSLDGYGYDVIVLGSGAGGFTAAVRSAESGARTLLLEAAPWLGGASRIATGIFGCAGHPIQKAHGHTTTADDLYALYLSEASATHTRAEQTVAKMLAYGAVDAADWLASLGVRWSQKTSQPFFLHVEEGHRLGELLIDALERKARAENVTILTRTRATRLLTENGRVVGVEADTRSGPRTFRAKAVVLATGGFEAAPDWIRKYVGHGWERAGVYCTPYNRGDSQRMAEAIGVPLDDMAVMKANPTIHVSAGNRYNLISTVQAGAIAVNRKGERLINETGGYWESHRIQAEPEHALWLVFGDPVFKADTRLQPLLKAGSVVRAETAAELEAKTGINARTLEATVRAYEQSVRDKMPDPFGRKVRKPAFGGAYYAARIEPMIQGTFGGVRTAPDTRVLRANGTPVPGLYATGECAANGLRGVNPQTANVVFGSEAGRNAARFALRS